MLRIGLTGGIACGKSTVAELFAELGATIVDTDVIARELVEPGKPAFEAIVTRFGADILGTDGGLDRDRLRGIVFKDEALRKALEAILHPRIREEALKRARAAPGLYVILVVPLLFETRFDQHVDRTVAVDCPQALQIERLERRDGIDESEARAILAAQMDRTARCQAADDIVDNSGDIESTRRRVAELHAAYLEWARNCS